MGHSAREQTGVVDILGAQRMEFDDEVNPVHIGDGIRRIGPLGGRHARLSGKRIDVLIGEAQR
ncbi:hypothetical protein SDC9_56188 [bioreactor metagenome]|uniref:Uncharacterized protein n=1 Tax=bioreactor metagenome TaxID=1076179 RepID=A0A644X125_9ZZZZ